MVCKINEIPEYIQGLNISEDNKAYARNAHYNIANELMNITDLDNKSIFVQDKLGEYDVTMINPFINQQMGLFFAEGKIDELNEKYGNSVKLLDSVGRKVVAINVSDFANKLESENDPNLTKRLLDTGRYFNLSAHADQKIKQSTLSNMLTFLSKLGIKVEQVDAIEHGLDPRAMADFTKRIVQYAKGYEATLPEEAAHFLTMLMPKDHPVMVEAMQQIVNDPIYQEVLAEYYDAYEGNELKLRHEAIGQLVARRVAEKDKQAESWFKAMISWFRNLLANAYSKKDDVFDNLAYRLLNADISDLSFENVQDEVSANGLFFNKTRFQQLTETLEASQKKEKIINSIKNSFSIVNELSKDLRSLKDIKMEAANIKKIDKVARFLKDTIQKMGNTSMSAVNTFVDMVVHTEDFLEDFQNEIEFIDRMSDPNAKLIKVDQLRLATRLLTDKIIPQLAAVGRNLDKGNELSTNIGNILRMSQYINDYINVQYQDLAIDILEDRLKDRYEEYKRKFQEEIAPLENQLKDAMAKDDKARVKLLENSIKEKKDFFMVTAPSRDVIEKTITGQLGDSSSFGFWVESASMNENIIINELHNIFKQSIFSRFEQMQKILNQAQTAVDKYQSESGLSKNNTEKFNSAIIEEVKLLDFIDDEGVAHYRTQKALMGKYNKDYIHILEEMSDRIYKTNSKIFKEKDPKKVEELQKQLADLILKKNKWERENMELEYKDEYYEIDSLLDKDLGGGVTARLKTNDIYEKIRMNQRALKFASDIDLVVSIYDEIDRLNMELRDLRSEYNKTGIDLDIAKQLKKHADLMRDKVKWILTDESYANHEKYLLVLKRQLDNKEIDQATYDLNVERSYNIEYSPEYYKLKRELSDELKRVLSLFGAKAKSQNAALNENISELYDKIEEIAKRYRGYNGTIEGNMVPENEAKEIKDLQKKIDEFRKQIVKMTGFTEDDLAQRDVYIKQLSLETNEDKKNEIREKIKEINQKAEKAALPDSVKETVIEIMEDLRSITRSQVTDEYTSRLEQEKQKIDVAPIDKTKHYDINGEVYMYNPQTDTWVSNILNTQGELATLTTEELDSLNKDLVRETEVKKTDWFTQNHIVRIKYENRAPQEYYDPIYIWKKSSPTDESLIKKVPAFRFRERQVNEDLQNPNYKNTVDGYNVPKKGKFENPNYNKLSAAQKKYLEFWTDLYIGIQEAYLPSNKRLGLFLPSIEKSSYDKAMDFTIQSIGASMKEAYEGAKRRLLSNDQDADIAFGNVRDDVFGDMPILFMGKIDSEIQSSDIARSILTFISHVIKYDSLKKTKPLSNAILNTVSIEENKPVAKKEQAALKLLMDFAGGVVNSKYSEEKVKGDSVMQRHVDDLIRSFLYNQTEFEERVGAFNIGKSLNNSMGIAAIGMMAFKPLANIKNNVAGKIQMFLASSLLSKKLYTPTNLVYGQMMSPKVLVELANDYYKIGNLGYYHQLLSKFNAFQGEFYNEFGQKVSATLFKDVVNLRKIMMIPKNFAEVEMQIVNALAVLDSIYVEHDGKKIPLHQAFESKGGELKQKFAIPQAKIEEAINKIAYANIVTNGNYDKMNRTVAEKYSMGRMLLFMNKYFIPFFQFRFAGKKYNASINETTTGYNRLFLTTIINDVKAGLFPFANMVKNPNDYTAEEKSAALTTAYEVAIIASLGIMYSVLGGDSPDKYSKLKEDPNGYWKAQILALTLGVKLETETMHPYYGIDNIAQKMKSPFPVARLYENLTKFAYSLNFNEGDFYKEDSGIYKEGDWKGVAYALRLTGIEGMLLEAGYPIERLKRVEQSQFIK
jgi:hypothetical protein